MNYNIVQSAAKEMLEHINSYDTVKSNWYCGIASDWKERLFKDHKVPAGDEHPYIAWDCKSEANSRAVEKYLLDIGCDGGGGGGSETTVFAYAYLKSPITSP